MTKKKKINFNQVDAEKLKQIQDLYTHYHNIAWIYRHSHKENKKKNYAMNIYSERFACQCRSYNRWCYPKPD